MGIGLKDLRVWQESVALAAGVVTAFEGPKQRLGARTVTERAIVTASVVPERIAAGYGQYAPERQREEYRAAKAELLALETQLAVIRGAGLLKPSEYTTLTARVQTVNRLLSGFLVYLDRQLDSKEVQ